MHVSTKAPFHEGYNTCYGIYYVICRGIQRRRRRAGGGVGVEGAGGEGGCWPILMGLMEGERESVCAGSLSVGQYMLMKEREEERRENMYF